MVDVKKLNFQVYFQIVRIYVFHEKEEWNLKTLIYFLPSSLDLHY